MPRHLRTMHVRWSIIAALFGAALSGQVAVQAVSPAAGTHNAPRSADISARLNEAVDPATVTPSTFVVRSFQTSGITEGAAWRAGATPDVALLDLDRTFFAGEEVEVTLTKGLMGVSGAAPGKGRVWRFRAATGAGPMDFSRDILTYSANTEPSDAIGVGDMNGDGFVDIVLSATTINQQGSYATRIHSLQIFSGDGVGGFVASSHFAVQTVTAYRFLDIGDIDGDGDLDLVAAWSDRFSLFINDGRGVFTDSSRVAHGTIATNTLCLADMNGDGSLDLLVGIHGKPDQLYDNDGVGSFSAIPRTFGAEKSYTKRFAVDDLDGDGDLDVVQLEQYETTILKNDGAGGLTAASKWANAYGRAVALGDFDSDGALDIAIANDGTNLTYRNDGAGSFAKSVPFGGANTSDVAAGDIDGDGDMDLVIGNRLAQSFIYLNNGSGKFGKTVAYGGKESRLRVALADFDGDGDLDIAVSDFASDKKLFRNGVRGIAVAGNERLPNANEAAGLAYSYAFSASYGVQPYVWSLNPANPGGWLAIDPITGILSGVAPPGSGNSALTFDVTVRDGAGAGAAKTRTFTLYINPPPAAPPYFEDFESPFSRYSVRLGDKAQAYKHADAAQTGAQGLILDGTSGRENWSLQDSPTAPGKAAADDPARWFSDAADHQGIFEWVVDCAGVNDVEVSFDYKIVYHFQKWYANLVFEWSDDAGQSWHVASDAGAAANHIYRGEVEGTAQAAWKSARIPVQGMNGQGFVVFRFRWIAKLSRDDTAGKETFIAIDNLRVGLPGQAFPIAPNSLPNVIEGHPVSQSFTASGGIAPYTWQMTGLPSWLAFDTATGLLSGTAPLGAVPQTVTLTVTATDAVGTPSARGYSFNIVGKVRLTTTALREAVEGARFGPEQLTRSDGIGPFTWTVIGGTLPKGLKLDPTIGAVSGISAKGTVGAHTFTVEVSDSATGDADSGTVTLTITPGSPLVIVSGTGLPPGEEFKPWSASIHVSGGIAPYTFGVIGSLPPWLNLDANTGGLSGTPRHGDSRQYSFGIIVTDNDSPSGTVVRNYLLDISSGPLPRLSGLAASAAGGCALTGQVAPARHEWLFLAMVAGGLFSRLLSVRVRF